jgi:hypothetical protein
MVGMPLSDFQSIAVAGLEGVAPPEHPLAVEHRSQLIYLLREAAELEHGIMCQYLFAAFSLKQSVSEGVTAEQLQAIGRWREVILDVARQEMLHLALVQNLLTSIGAAPHLGRPDFPSPAPYFPPGVSLALVPFSEQALRHFLYLERPEGMPLDDAEGFVAAKHARPLADTFLDENTIVARPQDFETVGHLYRAIDVGFAWLTAKLGERRLFVGPPSAQATAKDLGWPQLVAVTNLKAAHAAVDTIVEQGEGVRGEWRTAHFGRFLDVLQDYIALRTADPSFEPARRVCAGTVHERADSDLPVIDDPVTAQVADLFDVSNEIVLLALTRFFATPSELKFERKSLVDVAVGLMFTAIEPLGQTLTSMPFGPARPGYNAAPTFRLVPQGVSLLPHRAAALVVLEERLREAAEFGRRISATPGLDLSLVCEALEQYAATLAQVDPI